MTNYNKSTKGNKRGACGNGEAQFLNMVKGTVQGTRWIVDNYVCCVWNMKE